ncbi:choline transporter [Penicillium brasilianum]|uniref:Choline transporter n=1 Tax=Penicillium brasilianum TaxID=104259 RepID=A0A1S9RE17_PENBI|nr:choline transporter [Penicillium brasilianum]
MATNLGTHEYQGSESKSHLSKNEKMKDDTELGQSEPVAANGLLEALGYEPELTRNRSTLQVAFMSFVLASIPYGLATTFIYPLVGGGPVNIIWGWLIVSIIILCVALSLGEITSVYPTAGGVYYQSFMLSPPSCRRIIAWICGWAYVVGNVMITLAVNFGSAQFLIACVNVFEVSPGVGVFEATAYQTFLIFLAITLLCNAVSSMANKWLPYIDTFAIFWTFAGVLAVVICTLVVAKNGRHDAEYVFGNFEPQSGWPVGWSFCVGLLQAAYTTSSTGMVISMCEEVQHPSKQVPKAIVGTVILNTLAGFLFLIPLVFVLPDSQELIALVSGQPVPTIMKSAVGNSTGAFLLLLPLIVLALICGIGCTTTVSRSIWAFARDGGIPYSSKWRQVNKSLDVPFNAMMLGMVVEIALGLIYFGSTTAFNAFSGVGVITLTVSYACPIAVSFMGGRKEIKHGDFDLGKLGAVCNVVALAWSVLAVPLFCMPSAIPVTAETVNYAPVVFVAFILIATVWYWAWGYRKYVGPPTVNDAVIDIRFSRE